jgi:hypothetical protein
MPVPEIAVNAIVIAAGKVNQRDRLFACFQEYSSVFNIPHTVHSYNALLRGLAMTHHAPVRGNLDICGLFKTTGLLFQLEKVFAVLEDMEVNGIAPNRDTMSLIVEVACRMMITVWISCGDGSGCCGCSLLLRARRSKRWI